MEGPCDSLLGLKPSLHFVSLSLAVVRVSSGAFHPFGSDIISLCYH